MLRNPPGEKLRQFGLFHQTYDLLFTPTLPIAAFPVGQASPQTDLYPPGLNWTPFTYPFNLTQQPDGVTK